MTSIGNDSLNTRRTLSVDGKDYDYFSLPAAAEGGLGDLTCLPYSLKVLLENLLRHEDGRSVTADDIKAVATWLENRRSDQEIAYRPARVLMQDFTGVPAVVDLAAMREAVVNMGGDPERINPQSPVDLVIDHSVMVDHAGTQEAMAKNIELEFQRNGERYAFLRWGSQAFDNFRVVPPGTGICHQVNVEYLAQVIWKSENAGKTIAYPDTLVGTDSHTTMVNGLAVLGWGVGGIEAEAAMLGQPISMLLPEVVGMKLTGKLPAGTTATDLVLTVTEMLRAQGVVGKFVEFFGPGLDNLPLTDRATIANMAPEYGATCGFFPVDNETLRYLEFTSRNSDQIKLVEAYAKAQGMWRDSDSPDPMFTTTLDLDMNTVVPCVSGPTQPNQRVDLDKAKSSFNEALPSLMAGANTEKSVPIAGADYALRSGDVVIAAITSCTNTSNPSVLVAAGLVAQKALEKGLQKKPWVKSSLAPGSQVVADYLQSAGLQKPLDALGFNVVGFGCTTCIGNSGPLDEPISDAITEGNLVATAVLSGNRNFEGRISPFVRANYLASPPLVVAYALAGSLNRDITTEPLGEGSDGEPVFLKDIWPTQQEVADTVAKALTPEMFSSRYSDVFTGPPEWQAVEADKTLTYDWDAVSTYVQHPPYFEGMAPDAGTVVDLMAARELAMLGDSVTTDHISPAGSIAADSPAASYLNERQVPTREFNSYGSRRGNHEVMMRGTFANVRIRNEMAPGTEGGVTKHQPSGEQMSVYDAAMRYQREGVPLVIVAGKEYGTGSSRDWAAKGTQLLGVKAVIVESFERIHRSNLVGMGVLPLQFKDGENRQSLNIEGAETFDITGISDGITPRQDVSCTIHYADGSSKDITLLCRIDTLDEVEYHRHGGILQYVLRNLMKAAA